MKIAALKLAALGLCALALTGCLGATSQAPSSETRTIRFTYCTGPDGAMVADPAAANAKGMPLKCFNFIAR